MRSDTIVAISTALGAGAIGLVRLSGPDSNTIAGRCFRRGRPLLPIDVCALESHRLTYGAIVDPQRERVVDEVLLARMAAPHTYTREDVVEISCHGGAAAVQEILALCLRLGARLAEPGEFTLRAFANGRIDLAQAEAVADIVSARTSNALELAVEELRGKMAERLRPVRDALVETLAYLDAAADFPDDEIPDFVPQPALAAALARLRAVVEAGRAGLLYTAGVRIAIVGRPNVGKSSLLNALLKADRAIVTPIAGTTRDVISETLSLRGIPATVQDTAGIAESADVIEQLGIERSQRTLEASGIALLVLDRSSALTEDDRRVAALLQQQRAPERVIVVLNKSDLPAAIAEDVTQLVPGAPVVALSAATGAGLATLEASLHDAAIALAGDAAQPALVTERQLDALHRAQSAIAAALLALDQHFPLDLVAIDTREALTAIGEITGENVSEAVLDEIFRRFCIGK